MSDIVDNRREKLVDSIGRIVESTESARFAVGRAPLVNAVGRLLNQLQRRSVGATRSCYESWSDCTPATGCTRRVHHVQKPFAGMKTHSALPAAKP